MPLKLRNVSQTVIITLLLILSQGTPSYNFAATTKDDNPLYLFDSAFDSQIIHVIESVNRMNYSEADSVLKSIPISTTRIYFQGLVDLSRFNDLGDTAALWRAEGSWQKLIQGQDSLLQLKHHSKKLDEINNGIFLGLSELQLSYIDNLKGEKLRSTRMGMKAISHLKLFPGIAEAIAAIALYNYYKADLLKGVNWVPFVHVDTLGPISQLETAIHHSRYLKNVFETSLLWLYYDQKKYAEGLIRINHFLDLYPQNRLYRQMKADFLFREGDSKNAKEIHESLYAEYARLKSASATVNFIPIGYLSSLGNLIKINHAENQTKLMSEQLLIWNSPEAQKNMSWLPKSLKKEVEMLNK